MSIGSSLISRRWSVHSCPTRLSHLLLLLPSPCHPLLSSKDLRFHLPFLFVYISLLLVPACLLAGLQWLFSTSKPLTWNLRVDERLTLPFAIQRRRCRRLPPAGHEASHVQ